MEPIPFQWNSFCTNFDSKSQAKCVCPVHLSIDSIQFKPYAQLKSLNRPKANTSPLNARWRCFHVILCPVGVHFTLHFQLETKSWITTYRHQINGKIWIFLVSSYSIHIQNKAKKMCRPVLKWKQQNTVKTIRLSLFCCFEHHIYIRWKVDDMKIRQMHLRWRKNKNKYRKQKKT